MSRKEVKVDLDQRGSNNMGTIYPSSRFYNAQNAFVVIYDFLCREGLDQRNGDVAFFNFGFYLENSVDRGINVDWRKWDLKQANKKWEDFYDFYSLTRIDQAIQNLKGDESSKLVSIKLRDSQTLSFKIIRGELCMTVTAKDQNLWTDFLDLQYCFSKLQEMIARELDLRVGWYYHFAKYLFITREYLGESDRFYRDQKLEIEEGKCPRCGSEYITPEGDKCFSCNDCFWNWEDQNGHV